MPTTRSSSNWTSFGEGPAVADDAADPLPPEPPRCRQPLPKCPEEMIPLLNKSQFDPGECLAFLDAALEAAEGNSELLQGYIMLYMNRFFVFYWHKKLTVVELQYSDAGNLASYLVCAETHVRSMLSNVKFQVPWNRKLADVSKIHKEDPRRLTVKALEFKPNSSILFDNGVMNTFCGIACLRQPAAPGAINEALFEPLMKQLRRLCGADAMVAVPFFLDILAWILQKRRKPQVAVFFMSDDHGVGKGLLLNGMIRHLFGNTHSISFNGPPPLRNNCNAQLADKLFLFIDEAGANLTKSECEGLKHHITEPDLEVRRMHCNPVTTTDHSFMCFAADHIKGVSRSKLLI